MSAITYNARPTWSGNYPNLYTCLYKAAYLRLTEGFVFEPPEEGETFTDADFSRLEALASRVALIADIGVFGWEEGMALL